MRRYAGAFLPAMLSVALFGATVFWMVLPGTEAAILAKKKEMISELTLSVWSLLSTYHQQELAGSLSRAEAQSRALSRLRQMRYGEDGKDYFWVTDLNPRVVMHPFRTEMEGMEVSQYADVNGKRFFQDMIRVARVDGQGFVSYTWQWKDDPSRQVPKLSHVRLFVPWGWVVGTGIYTEDVHREMAVMTRNLTLAGAGVMVVVSLLAGYITWHNIRSDEQRKRAEDALAESEERFRGISANALDGIVMIDPRGCISFWNKAAESIFGYASEEVIGVDMHLLLAPLRYQEAYRQAFANFITTGEGQTVGKTVELSAIRKDGQEIPVELSVAPLHRRGEWHAVGIIRDITQRKLNEESLQLSEEKFRRLFEASPVMLVISTMEDGLILEANDAALSRLGFKREEIIGKRSRDLGISVNEAERQEAMAEYRMTGKALRRELTLSSKDGARLELLWMGDVIEYDGKQCLLNLLLDISQAKKARLEKEQLEGRLRQAQKMEAIGTLAGGIAHDFNNILSAVLGYSDLALMRIPPADKAHKHIRQVYQAGLRAKELVQQILAFSRQSKLERTPVELRLLVKEALKMLRATIPATISMVSDIQPTHAKVLADPGQLHQIVMNLCTNAAQAMGHGGGILTVNLSEETLSPYGQGDEGAPPPGAYLRLTVRDTGAGMSPQVSERIFEPFFTTKGKGEGTGLGLSVVHGIVKDLNGSIDVTSALGQGSTFGVWLPVCPEDLCETAPVAEAMPRGQERILVVDDEETVAQSHRLMLESLGYSAKVCTSSLQALDVLAGEGGEIDLLFTDLAMPNMDGIELIRNLRRSGSSLPVILVTGFADEKHAQPQLLEELSVAKVMLKPLVKSEMAWAVRKALDSLPASRASAGTA